MLKNIIFLFLSFYSFAAMACPGCFGQDPNDKNVFIIISIFVVACYIPMFIIYRTIFKNRHINKQKTS